MTVADQVRAWFQEDNSRMTLMASREFGIPEAEVLRALQGTWPITELRAGAFAEILSDLQGAGAVRIFVRSSLAVMETVGRLGDANFSEAGPFFNIDGGGLDIHIFRDQIHSAFAVEKPSHMGPRDTTYSIQFFDPSGHAGLKIFLWEHFPRLPREDIDLFHRLVSRHAGAPPPQHTAAKIP